MPHVDTVTQAEVDTCLTKLRKMKLSDAKRDQLRANLIGEDRRKKQAAILRINELTQRVHARSKLRVESAVDLHKIQSHHLYRQVLEQLEPWARDAVSGAEANMKTADEFRQLEAAKRVFWNKVNRFGRGDTR